MNSALRYVLSQMGFQVEEAVQAAENVSPFVETSRGNSMQPRLCSGNGLWPLAKATHAAKQPLTCLDMIDLTCGSLCR